MGWFYPTVSHPKLALHRKVILVFDNFREKQQWNYDKQLFEFSAKVRIRLSLSFYPNRNEKKECKVIIEAQRVKTHPGKHCGDIWSWVEKGCCPVATNATNERAKVNWKFRRNGKDKRQFQYDKGGRGIKTIFSALLYSQIAERLCEDLWRDTQQLKESISSMEVI